MFKARADGMDGCVKPVKIAFDFHADNAAAIRTTKAAQVQTAGHLIKVGQDKTVSPQPQRAAPGAFVRFGPIKFTSLGKNVVEFCRNEKYHRSRFNTGSIFDPSVLGGDPVGQPSPPLFF